MSSILEALERAEEERGHGAKRALGIAPPVETGNRFSINLILTLAVLLLVVALAIWFYSGQATPPASVELQPKDVPTESEAPVPQAASTALATAPTPAKATLSVPAQLRLNTSPSAKPLMEEAVVAKPPPRQKMAAPPAVKPALVPTTAENREATAPPSVRPAQADNRVVEMVRRPVAEPVVEAPEEAFVEPEAPITAQRSEIPLVWELPQSEREKVLQLKSSVHVYNQDPAQRFVIINMRRYAEGDSLPPHGLRLERIDQDGVVIDYGGGLVRLMRR